MLDRFLFDTAMSDPEICRNILSIILGEKEVPPGLVEFLHYVENPEQQEREIQDERVRKLAGQIEMFTTSSYFLWIVVFITNVLVHLEILPYNIFAHILFCPYAAAGEAEERDDRWKAFRIQGILDFSLIGVLAPIAAILADNQIGIFAFSTYNTDYILVRKENFDKALDVLTHAGYSVL